MILRPVCAALAAAGMGCGIWLLATGTALRPPRFPDLVRIAGPLRGLPVPFLWDAWGRARRRHDSRAAAAIGRWLTWLLPERSDLFVGFAWDLAYGDLPLETEPARQAHLLRDAIRLLDEGARLHPESYRFAADASFLLLDRCAGSPERERLGRSFEELTGVDPIALAFRYAEIASRLAPHVQLHLLRRAIAMELQGLDAAEANQRARAAAKFAGAALLWQGIDDERSARLAELAAGFRRVPLDLSSSLRKWLIQDHRLGRNRLLWEPR